MLSELATIGALLQPVKLKINLRDIDCRTECQRVERVIRVRQEAMNVRVKVFRCDMACEANRCQ